MVGLRLPASPLRESDTPLAYSATPPDQLGSGDFNGDEHTDVFALKQRCTIELSLALH